MPTSKDLKRIVRARMQKTGESYTSARSQVLEKRTPSAARCAELAGFSNTAVKAKTGHTWKQWVQELDAVDATGMAHRDIVKHIHASYDVTGWWAQMVTVGYERVRGLREVGQRCDGQYNANKSKTFAVPISKLYRAFSTKPTRSRWLPGVDLKIRTATVEKSMRITWPDDTSVHAYFTAKGSQKSQVAIQHVGLVAKADITKRKEFWTQRLAALGDVLSHSRSRR